MTAFGNDFDRRLASFLDDGPTRAPERAVDVAIAHAHAHPRRPDPFRALRRDVMARPMLWGARPVLVFAALGLLLVMSLAAVYVGSQRQPSVLPPSPTETPAPSPSPQPSPSASPSPSVAPPAGPFETEVIDGLGRTKTVTVVDQSGLVVGAFSWEGDQNAADETRVDQLPADEGGGLDSVVVHWIALPCSDDFVVTVDESGRGVTIESPSCEGDTLPVDHAVWIQFSETAPADEFSATIVRN
jgi:hypothetical protein